MKSHFKETLISPRAKSVILVLVLVLLAAGYFRILYKNLCPIAGGADSSGYLNASKMLSNGKLIEPIKPLELFSLGGEFTSMFRPLGYSWGVRNENRVPLYPIGMPWHMMIFARLFGWETGPFLPGPLAAVLALLLMIFLARRFRLPWSYSIAAGVVLSAVPAWLFIAVQPMSDVLAAFWVLAAVLAAVSARERAGWAVLSGAAFGISVLVRPTDAMMVIPLFFALPAKPRAWAMFIAGCLPFGVYDLALNHALYGGWLTTGYRGTIIKDLALGYFLPRFGHYVRWLSVMLTPLVPVAWLGLPFLRRISLKDKMLLVTWFLTYFLFYCFYWPYEEWWYLRFLLPGLPALILGALLMARYGYEGLEKKYVPRTIGWAQFVKPAAWITAGLLFVAILGTEARQTKKLGALKVYEAERIYRESCLQAKTEWPTKSIVLTMQTSGALTYYTEFIPCRWDETTPEKFAVLRPRAEAHGYGFYAMLFPFEEQEFQKHAPGRWEKIGGLRHVSFWHLLPGPRP